MHSWGKRRGLAMLAVLALMASAACSGNKSVSANKTTGGQQPGTTVDTQPPDTTPGASTTIAAGTGTTLKGSTSKSGVKASTVSGTGPSVAGTKQETSSGFTYTAANIFTPAQDRIGITDSQITLCTHAALVLGPAFNDSAKDFQVYWQQLNDAGGIYGRKINQIFTDDQYSPQGGVAAAQQCQQSNPFVMSAGVGFDTVPAVRQWAEQNKMLYLASFATENGLYGLKYTFEPQPSVEHFGEVAGNYIGAKHPGKIGVLWRNSPNWQGGRDKFTAAVKAKGSKVVADVPVQQNQGDYTSAILALKSAGAETVFAWVNVLEFAQLEKQANAQNFHPRWVTATFNLVTDTLGHDVDGSNGHPPAVGLWVTPEYHNGDTTSPWAAEEKKMQAAYAKYDSGHTITDTDWQVWLAFRNFQQILLDCGKDCTRNKLAGMFLAGYKLQQDPLCAIDFSRGRGKLGSFEFNVMEGTNRNGTSGWKQVETCKETF
ncbi:MAG: ABC transporter substrate-binding protein [Actinobacteria bacterium]|nr:ABC transporter substrate-binding protein [Actinomycetota bacterium]